MRYSLSLLLFVTVLVVGCSGQGGPATPTAPSPAPAASSPTRIINVSGNLAFGEVSVGSSQDLSFTISNSGTSALAVSGMSVSGGLAQLLTASWTSGSIGPGGSQTVTVRFSPTATGSYSGTLTVNADQTSGTNSIPISATATSSIGGTWQGQYVVERCDGTGSLQDLLCSTNRGSFPVGTPLPIRFSLTQNGPSVTGTVSFGQVTGPVSGAVTSDGLLTLQGSATSGTLTLQISTWSTRVQGNSMVGNVSYNATVIGVPGVGVLVTRLSGVNRQ
jgi:hypothetical protein